LASGEYLRRQEESILRSGTHGNLAKPTGRGRTGSGGLVLGSILVDVVNTTTLLSRLKEKPLAVAVDVVAGRPWDEMKSNATRIESHPETGTFA
jgi:hypothetical protein